MLWRLLGLKTATKSERSATFWVALMAFATLASTFVLRPIRGQFGVSQGVEGMPELYGLTLLASIALIVPFWTLANRMASRRFVPISLHVGTAVLLAVAVALWWMGDYQWQEMPWVGKAFWGGFSVFNVALPALVWIHAVSHYGKSQSRRLFGLIAVGATLGAMVGSEIASLSSDPDLLALPNWVLAVLSACLLQVALCAFLRSCAPCSRLDGGDSSLQVASGGVWQGLRIVVRDRRAMQIAIYMMLVGFVATAFEAGQTELVGHELDRAWEQQTFLADVGVYGNALVLVLQVMCTGRLMTRFSPTAMLSSLPVVSIVGLVLYAIAPTAGVIFALQIARRGANYAIEKPAREVLYTPLDLATKHKVKFLLDTFALRLGDFGGAVAQVWLRQMGFGVTGIVAVTIVFAVAWIGVAWLLGRRR
jgi:ATP:ADP antiporter, AAA family